MFASLGLYWAYDANISNKLWTLITSSLEWQDLYYCPNQTLDLLPESDITDNQLCAENESFKNTVIAFV